MKTPLLFLSLLCLTPKLVSAQFGDDGNCSPGVYRPDKLINPNLIRATFRYTIPGVSICTGCLVNQLVSGRPRQFFITARHCLRTGTNGSGPLANLDNLRFVFNFQSRNGDNSTIPITRFPLIGNQGGYPEFRYAFDSPATLIYESTGLFGSGIGIDIAMLEIVRPIPPHFNTYYAGWKADALLGSGGVLNAPMTLVHHPSGDAKKRAETSLVAQIDNRVSSGCRIITKVFDAIISVFGGKSTTETICSYVDVPQYVVPLLTSGAIRGGSSGSPFFTNGNRLFGVTSLAIGECVDIGATFGKFRNAYANREMRDALNPSYNVSANLFGIDGRAVGCYSDNPLRLSGNYFPARDYQTNPQQVISAAINIEAGTVPGSGNAYARFDPTGTFVNPPAGNSLEEGFLRIYNGADFVFTAGQTIRLLPGFTVDAGASFTARIQGCNANARVGAVDSLVQQAGVTALPPVTPAEEEPADLVVSPNPGAGLVRCQYVVRQPGAV